MQFEYMMCIFFIHLSIVYKHLCIGDDDSYGFQNQFISLVYSHII